MNQIQHYNPTRMPDSNRYAQIANFLFKHLEEYGDPLSDIEKAMDYALAKQGKPGGSITVALDGEQVVSAVVVNQTGMQDYIPENILVYIATARSQRGKGIGKKMMEYVIENTDGDIALHVEPDNPAKILYERLGFTNKYLEMRLKNKS